MVELHSNFTVEGSKTVTDGVLPSNHAMHETLEITQGYHRLVRNRLLRFHQHSAGWRLAVGGRPHPSAGPGSGILALAGGREYFE